MSAGHQRKPLPFFEFVTLMAIMTSLVALTIDAMLPALPEIGRDLGVEDANQNQHVISSLFVGLAFGQLVFGPLSDSIGRKPAIYLGFTICALGCVLSMMAGTFSIMLAGRALQGFGAACARTVCTALIRDMYEGRAMARVLSFTMAIFILVPTIAPAIGQGIIMIADWRAIFAVFLFLVSFSGLWFALRQPETLTPEKRSPFAVTTIAASLCLVFANRTALGYTIAAGFIFGILIAYLNLAQQVLQVQYGLGNLFPLYFGILALSIGLASVINAKLVMRHGMHKLSNLALITLIVLSSGYLVVTVTADGMPAFWGFMAFMLMAFFCLGALFGNLTSIAMEPMGHIAGIASAFVNCGATIVSVPFGVLAGQLYEGTITPLIASFLALSVAALLTTRWVGRKPGETAATP